MEGVGLKVAPDASANGLRALRVEQQPFDEGAGRPGS